MDWSVFFLLTPNYHLSGLDVQLADLVEEVLYHHNQGDVASSRLLLIDNSGRTLAHPLLPPLSAFRLPHLASLEVGLVGFDSALHRMTSLPSGSYTTRGNITYTWQHVRWAQPPKNFNPCGHKVQAPYTATGWLQFLIVINSSDKILYWSPIWYFASCVFSCVSVC